MLNSAVQRVAIKKAQSTMSKTLYDSLNIDIATSEIKKIPSKEKRYMLYAHVPFCHVFCPYCSFHKYAYEPKKAKKYFANLRDELRQMKKAGYDFSSMYVGGGTTLIDEDELLETLNLAKELFNIDEISCETDPSHIEPKNLEKFRGVIDRMSVGVQSFDDEILKKVARYEKFGSSEILQKKLKDAIGILPITSLDLIFNFPFQTKENLLNDIKIAKALNPEQITFYPLMKSEITKESIAKSLGVSYTDNEWEFYKLIKESFKDFNANNAWAFSKVSGGLSDEYVGSNHEYVGVGSGAFSFLDGRLLINAFDLDEYSALVENEKSTVIASCEFGKKERVQYLFLTELFDGAVEIKKFNVINKTNLKKELFFEINALKFAGAIREKDGVITPTEFGSYLTVVLMKDFYAGMDKVRAVFKDGTKVKSTKKLRVMEA